jgi:transcription elongation factor Elf1
MSNIIPFHVPKPLPKRTVCSFCNAPKHKVKKLVATETYAICDVCLEQASQRLKESE